MSEDMNVVTDTEPTEYIEPVPVTRDAKPQLILKDVPEPDARINETKNPFNDPNLAAFCSVLQVDKFGLQEWFIARVASLESKNDDVMGVLASVIESFRRIPLREKQLLQTLVIEAAEVNQRVLASPRMSNTYSTMLSPGFKPSSSFARELDTEQLRASLAAELVKHDARMTELARALTPASLKETIVFFHELGLDVGIGSFIAMACANLHTMDQAELRAYIDMPGDTFKAGGDPLEQIIKDATAWAQPLKPKIEGTEIITVLPDGTVSEKLVLDGELVDLSEFDVQPEVPAEPDPVEEEGTAATTDAMAAD